MTRIAFFGPLPPSKTGISEYDEVVLPLLREDFEVDVFLEHRPANGEGFSHADFFSQNRRHPYDLTLYQIGNSFFHEYMYGYVFQNPGAVVFHDFCLLHSRSEMLLKKKQFREYRAELSAVYPDEAGSIANAIITSAAGDLLFYQYPLFELILRSSLAVAAHTEFALKKLRVSDTPVIKIPHPALSSGTNGPDRLPGKFVVATFGYVTNAKRITILLEAISRIAEACCVIVGDVEDRIGLDHQIAKLGIQDRVLVTGRVKMEDFLQWMGRSDVIVNLRYPSAGEMSGTLIRALASGKPVILSRLQNLEEIPEDAVLQIRPDFEKQDLEEALQLLIRNVELRTRLSTNAKKYIQEQHRPELAKAQYRKLIETALMRKAEFRKPELPFHLRSGREILQESLKDTIPESMLKEEWISFLD